MKGMGAGAGVGLGEREEGGCRGVDVLNLEQCLLHDSTKNEPLD